ncbi:MAG: hypothetical protein JSS98_03160 [Bacteroidetes bacterium]|nr:hypothetical protein [Bacteroidota bacterium]MBS1735584.1 hypothetical protein [Bacteroidota bacterium]
MSNKKILGLDLGTNSIGWALIDKENQKIIGLGSRIVPMGDDKGNFESGKKITRNATRRIARGIRRGNHRYKLRRNKLLFALHKMNMLPEMISIGYFEQGINGNEIRLTNQFPPSEKLQKLFVQPIKKGNKNYKGDTSLSILELRAKSLNEAVSLKELGRIFYLLNQRRGYNGGGEEDEKEITNQDGETQKVKKIYKELKVVKQPAPVQHCEEIKSGKNKILLPVYKLKVSNVETGEIFEGVSIKQINTNDEMSMTLTKPSTDSKQIRFHFADDEVNWIYVGSDIVTESLNAKVMECIPIFEYKKKKWAYKIEVEDENEDEKIGNGTLLLKHTKNLEKIKLNELTEFEINITTKSDGTKEFEFLLPNKTSWKKNLESIEKIISENKKLKFNANELDATGKGNYHICHYFLERIKKEDGVINSDYKIRDNVILRKRYIEEFNAIWERQIQANTEFKRLIEDKTLLEEIINYIFPERDASKPITEQSTNSKKHELKKAAREKGLKEVIEKQIIYYQRKLKPQTDLIGGCQYETAVDKNKKPINRVIERSHPLFQEFRMWDQINKCYVDAKNPEGSKYKYSKRFLTKEEKENIYKKLHDKKELTYEGWCSSLNLRHEGKGWPRGLHKKEKFKGNETLKTIKTLLGESLFEKAFGDSKAFIHYQNEKYLSFYKILWETYIDNEGTNEMDITDKRVQKIRKFLVEHLDSTEPSENIDTRALQIAKYKFPRKYASLSAKAIQNLLPLMQLNSRVLNEHSEHRRKIELLSAIYQKFQHRLREYDALQEKNPAYEKISKALLADFFREYDTLTEPIDKGGWPYWAAAGLMYGRHTAEQKERITDYHQIQPLSKEETLRNPVVEQMTNETLQTIKSILKEYNLKPDDIEIRVELARELKNNAKERESMHNSMLSNAKANKFAAYELMQLEYEDGKKKIKPENYCKENNCSSSCYQSAKLREPTANEILKYRLWKEQGMVSPYTGNPIPLCKLFDHSQYDKEHIIPKQRFFDDSQSNLVMAEKTVNSAKDNLTAIEFIRKYGGKDVAGFPIKTLNSYESEVMNHSTLSGGKKKKLLMKEIPEDFIERQKKETQYIARKVKEKLGSIVGLENVTTTTGGITDHLREMWKLNKAFKEMNKERFQLMATMVQEPQESWCHYKDVESKKGGTKKVLVLKNWTKRLDHRHHAIDALIIACTTQAQITQLNTLNQIVQQKLKEKYEDLKSREDISDEEISNRLADMNEKEKEEFQEMLGSLRQFEFPWEKEKFLVESRKKIEQLLVSFKSKKRLLIQNKEDKNGKRTNELILKVRGALHLAKSYGTKNIEKTATGSLEEAFNNPDAILNEIVRNEVKARKSVYSTLKEFKEKLKQEPIKYFDGEKEISISDGKSKIEINIGRGDVNTKTISWDDFAGADNPEKLIDKIVFKPLQKDIKDHFLIHNKGQKDEAFSDVGVDEFNKRRMESGLKSISKILIFFSKNSDEISLKPIIHKTSFKNNKDDGASYYETKDNYCYAFLQKNEARVFYPISFFDAATWVTNQFRDDLRSGYKFPKKYDDRLKYIEEIIKKKIMEDKPGFEIEFLLQQDDLVYLPFDKQDANKANSNHDNDFWFDIEKKRWKRIYRVVKFTGSQCYFIPFNYASPINYKPILEKEEKKQREKDDNKIPKEGIFEFGTNKNCSPFELTESYIAESLINKNRKFKANRIQDSCIKLNVDRLGNIRPFKFNYRSASNDENSTIVSEPEVLLKKN